MDLGVYEFVSTHLYIRLLGTTYPECNAVIQELEGKEVMVMVITHVESWDIIRDVCVGKIFTPIPLTAVRWGGVSTRTVFQPEEC